MFLRKLSRDNYHDRIKLTHRNEAKIKAEKVANSYRPISRVVIGREVDYRSRLIYVRYCFTNTTLCL